MKMLLNDINEQIKDYHFDRFITMEGLVFKFLKANGHKPKNSAKYFKRLRTELHKKCLDIDYRIKTQYDENGKKELILEMFYVDYKKRKYTRKNKEEENKNGNY